MELPVVVGHGSLLRMTGTRDDGHQPAPDAPIRCKAQCNADIDGRKPEVSSRTIEDTSQLAVLPGETGQLSVGRVTDIGKDEQHDGQKIEAKVLRIA